MILGIVLLLLAGIVAYFHYVQGALSATISLVLTIVCASLALSYYEPLGRVIMASLKWFDAGPTLALILLFAVPYFALRLVADAVVAGNIRLPLGMEKGVAAVAGLLVGLIVTGILAVGCQLLPFGPSVAGYARYATADRADVPYYVDGKGKDGPTFDEMQGDTFADADLSHLLARQDDLVVGMVTKFSDGGSLAGQQTFASIHPDLMQEMFGARAGIQAGAKKGLSGSTADGKAIDVTGVWMEPAFTQVDDTLKSQRKPDRVVKPVLKPEAGQTLLVVRIAIKDQKAAADSDGMIRLSCGAVRLCAGGANFFPVGTLQKAAIVYAEKPDDPLVFPGGGEPAADFVFAVENDKAFAPGSGKGTALPKLADGAFVEVKRLARVSVEGRTVDYGPQTPGPDSLIRRPDVVKIADTLPLQPPHPPVGPAAAAEPAKTAG